jgi:hypothetical protein
MHGYRMVILRHYRRQHPCPFGRDDGRRHLFPDRISALDISAKKVQNALKETSLQES